MSRYYLLTIPRADWEKPDELPQGCAYLKGQLERGEGGFEHWQVLVCTTRKSRCSGVKALFTRTTHVEPTRSAAANDYVWKDDTCVDPGTRFELGALPLNRSSGKDWDAIWESAKRGRYGDIPADVRIRCYSTLTKIAKDHMEPVAMEREVYVYWGDTGTGKSRRSWAEAGLKAYPKEPTTKFWDGYRGQEHVVIDEFRGVIDISHLLRWLDRYPVCVECKFGAVEFNAQKIWITSNLNPRDWYPNADEETKAALRRRFTRVVHFGKGLEPFDQAE